ncbi:expressed unknown protein [Seminavis robusta]|uniref:Uncharacterized protein n=1 Tax=Seminavis robusta TaxID=568900 RepID=A0A9N8H1B2_9STRA|nr:expressed unknown protein [Seminavis robusta]|eukprot:Sro37_g023150.1 n/a (860) ;mRNA; r:39017-41596
MPPNVQQQPNWIRHGSGSTQNILPSAIQLFNRLMAVSYENLGVADLEGDLAIQLIADFGVRIVGNPPISPSSNRPYAASTLKKYVETLALDLRTRFGTQPAFLNVELLPHNEVNTITANMAKANCRSLMSELNESDLFKDSWPLARQNSAATLIFPTGFHDPTGLIQMTRTIDMLSIAKTLFRRGETENLAKVVITWKSVGRAGEAKFLTYEKLHLDDYLNMCVTNMFQKKELRSTPGGFVPDWQFPELCPFFLLGAYWCLNHGLSRDPNDMVDMNSPAYRKSKYVFQSFHAITDAQVSTQITTIIRSVLPDQIKKAYSGRSLRYGAMTQLTWNPLVTPEEANAIGGWATGSSREIYIFVYLVAIMPPILALAGYPNPRHIPSLPNLHHLSTDNDPTKAMNPHLVNALIDALIVVSLPEFQAPNGKLRKLLHVVVAVMIQHYCYVEDTYSNSHPLVMKMIESVVSSGMAPNRVTACELLRHWSRKLTTYFRQANSAQQPTNNTNNPIQQVSNANQLTQLTSVISETRRDQLQLQQTLLASQQQITRLNQEVADLKSLQRQQLQSNQQLTSMIQQLLDRQPLNPPQNPRRVTPVAGRQATGTPAAGHALPRQPTGIPTAAGGTGTGSPRQPNPRQPTAAGGTGTPRQPNPRQPTAAGAAGTGTAIPRQPNAAPRQLRDATALIRSDAGRRGTRDDSQKVKNVLMDLYANNCFRCLAVSPALEDLARVVLNRQFSGESRNLNKIKLSLQLVDCMWSKECRQHCINHSFGSNRDALDAFLAVDKAVILYCHLNSNPKKLKPDPRRSSALLGVANTLQKKKLEVFLTASCPNWSEPTQTGGTLVAWNEQELDRLKNLPNNPYR